MNKIRLLCAICIAALFIGGCAGQKEPASQAVAAIESSLDAIRADASKYASDQLQHTDAQLAVLKESLAKGDYKAVQANAPGLASQVAELGQTVSTKKSEIQTAMADARKEWESLSADVPQMIAAVQSRVDVLGQARKLPKNLSADTFKAAQDGLNMAKSTWAEATASFGSGNAVDAVSKARTAKEKASEAMQTLGMG
ncbi:MAG: hypothetical protein ABW034_06560 [Steroidobacteraceae bacterium]